MDSFREAPNDATGSAKVSARRIAVLLLAKAAVAAAPRADMEALTGSVARMPGVTEAIFAFSEQGEPSLRDALLRLRRADIDEIRIVPLLVPTEPGFRAWITKTIARWQGADDLPWPDILVGSGPTASDLTDLVAVLVGAAGRVDLIETRASRAVEDSVIAAAARRVLVCQGGPCNEAGASVIWGHLRAAQARLGLRTAGRGMMSAKTTCLGPCALAPVVQVWPEGTVYGGVDEHGIDRIVSEHLLNDAPVEELAYERNGIKQYLRPVKASAK